MNQASRPYPTIITALADFIADYIVYAGRRGLAGVALVLLGAVFEGIGLAMIAPVLALLFQAQAKSGTLRRLSEALFGWTGVQTLTGRLVLLLTLFAGAMVVRAVVLLARDETLARLRIGFVEYQRTRVAAALAHASWDEISRLRHARIVQVMGGDMQQIGNATHFLTQALTALPMLAVQCTLAFYLNVKLALLALALLGGSAAALYPMMLRARALGQTLIAANQELLHSTAQFLGGLKLAMSQNLQTAFLDEFGETQTTQTMQQVVYLRRQTQTRLTLATFSAVIGAALVLLGLSAMHVPAATLVALLLVVTRMSGPFNQLQQAGQMVASALPAHEAVSALVQSLAPTSVPVSSKASLPSGGDIAFHSVSFNHLSNGEHETYGVHDLTLTLKQGTCVGIKGPSGAGKTTFADLLAGLYAPQTGAITVGGTPLCGALLGQWRNRIAYVAQDAFLFHDTVRRNLCWGHAGCDEREIWQALEFVEAAAFVARLPQGLETIAGERGTLVSGGERQRLALARALLRRPELLILDEATNALDPAMEQRIYARLSGLSPRPTIIIISHRPESLVHCDRVVALRQGCVAADTGNDADTPMV